jgi:Lysyl oxidase
VPRARIVGRPRIPLGAAVLVSAGVLTFLVACGDDAAELLPDLRQLPPEAISVTEVEGEHRLVFLSAVDNVGAAALVVEGRRESRADTTMAVEQVVAHDDGSTNSHGVDGELLYVVSATHEHWHLLDFERYSLESEDGDVVARDRKTGFCLGDRFNSEGTVSDEPRRPVWVGECGRGGRGLLSIREGISPGYGDDYVPALEGQYLVLDGLPAGRYRLWHRVNTERTLRESSYANNGASALLDLTWSRGEPSVTVVEP